MTYDQESHHRRSIRLQGFDYTQPGAYFITTVTRDRACLFGQVIDGEMRLNDAGEIARQCWLDIPNHFSNAQLDEFVIMPNHVHGVIVLVESSDMTYNVGARHAVPLPNDAVPLPNDAMPLPNDAVPLPRDLSKGEKFGNPISGSIPTIVRSYKSAVTKRINECHGTPGAPVWQRGYYEHIIRNHESLNRIREYIMNNPLQWALDRENPDAMGIQPAVPKPKDEPWYI
jgi:REP element-mobilizing transposase RayT